MLIALGMSLRIDALKRSFLPLLIPVSVLSLVIAPIVAFGTAHLLNMTSDMTVATVLLAAMPTMILGIVICERYQLDSAFYSASVFVTTVLSIITLTIWYYLLV
jgi:hypothetical protein